MKSNESKNIQSNVLVEKLEVSRDITNLKQEDSVQSTPGFLDAERQKSETFQSQVPGNKIAVSDELANCSLETSSMIMAVEKQPEVLQSKMSVNKIVVRDEVTNTTVGEKESQRDSGQNTAIRDEPANSKDCALEPSSFTLAVEKQPEVLQSKMSVKKIVVRDEVTNTTVGEKETQMVSEQKRAVRDEPVNSKQDNLSNVPETVNLIVLGDKHPEKMYSKVSMNQVSVTDEIAYGTIGEKEPQRVIEQKTAIRDELTISKQDYLSDALEAQNLLVVEGKYPEKHQSNKRGKNIAVRDTNINAEMQQEFSCPTKNNSDIPSTPVIEIIPRECVDIETLSTKPPSKRGKVCRVQPNTITHTGEF